MLEILRVLRLGAVNFFGIAVPGFLILFLATTGLLAPIAAVVIHACGIEWADVVEVWGQNRVAVLGVAALLSYVTGYILRLTSPDDLDKLSADHVLKQLNPAEREVWPYTGKPGDKFPYFNFRGYLAARSLTHLLGLVGWGPDVPAGSTSGSTLAKRSKTAIHRMKLETLLYCPELSAIVEGNEAHIRLMSGTWLAIRATQWLVLVGVLISTLAGALVGLPSVRTAVGLGSGVFDYHRAPPYFLYCLLGVALLGGMVWARRRIERLFHYRRVNELVVIVESAYLARQTLAAANAMKTHQPANALHPTGGGGIVGAGG